MSRVILSMTTVPSRLNPINLNFGIKPVIDRLTTLSYNDYEIHLNIPFYNKKSGEPYIVPEWLDNYESNKLKIFRTEDYGPLTKILPTLFRVKDPDTIIITVDDDLNYMDGFIEYHLEKRKEYPDCALGFAGLTAIDGSCHFCTTVKNDVRVKILEGYKTISYKRSFFEDDFEEFRHGSWNDDIIISAYLGMKNIRKFVISYDKDTDFSPVVESFPVIGHLPNERGGCWLFRNDPSITDNHNEFYKLGYLER
jgi:hypothetical protein